MRVGALLISLAMIIWLVWVDVTQPRMVQMTDFANSCYVAGRIVDTGLIAKLYPTLLESNYLHCDFPKIAHQILPLLPDGSHPVWQYSHLNALFFAPFSKLSIDLALFSWQSLNWGTTIILAIILSKVFKLKAFDMGLLLFSFAPLFMMSKFGQQGLFFGILPLGLGLICLVQKQQLLGGLALSCTFLNPKYLLVAGMFFAITSLNNAKVFAGFTIGLIFWILLMITTSAPSINLWLHALHLAELYFFDPHLVHKTFIYTSLPALAILNCPAEWRSGAKIIFYCFSALTALSTWLIARALIKQMGTREFHILALSLALLSMPITQPHLLFYDLSGMIVGILGLWQIRVELKIPNLGVLLITLWVCITGYFAIFAFNLAEPNPLLFIFTLTWLYFQILWSIWKFSINRPHRWMWQTPLRYAFG